MSTLRLVPVSGRAIEVEKDPITVGRDPSCDVVVTDGSVSRRHARIERRGGAWWVVDQGSANGTYVNSLRVAEQVLQGGQELRFGALPFKVEIVEDPEATVATPVLDEGAAATVLPASAAATTPPVAPRPPVPPRAAMPPQPPTPRPGIPPRPAAPSSPTPARRPGPVSPVPQMPAGAPPAKKGRSPLFWAGTGCCGCLLLLAALAAVIGGGVYMSTKGAADAAHAWIREVREGGAEAGSARVSSEYSTHVSQEANAAIAAAVRRSSDASFLQRSVDNDRAVMKGVLTGGGSPQPITVHLVKEGGEWKVDDVRLASE